MKEETAISVLEILTGYLFNEQDLVEHYEGTLPNYLPNAPVSEVTIIDTVEEDLPDEDGIYTDYEFQPNGAIIPNNRPNPIGLWRIEYTAGHDGLVNSPDWAETLVEELKQIELPDKLLRSESLGEYSYEICENLNDYPSVMTLISKNKRMII